MLRIADPRRRGKVFIQRERRGCPSTATHRPCPAEGGRSGGNCRSSEKNHRFSAAQRPPRMKWYGPRAKRGGRRAKRYRWRAKRGRYLFAGGPSPFEKGGAPFHPGWPPNGAGRPPFGGPPIPFQKGRLPNGGPPIPNEPVSIPFPPLPVENGAGPTAYPSCAANWSRVAIASRVSAKARVAVATRR